VPKRRGRNDRHTRGGHIGVHQKGKKFGEKNSSKKKKGMGDKLWGTEQSPKGEQGKKFCLVQNGWRRGKKDSRRGGGGGCPYSPGEVKSKRITKETHGGEKGKQIFLSGWGVVEGGTKN